ncbi:MAG: class I SAM-dependent methyltransferase [Bacteroidota bacterium]
MKDISKFEGDRAKNYDQFIQNWMPNYDSLLHCLPELLSSRMQTMKNKVLVVGSGTGNELEILANAKKEWQFLGIDPSPEMNVQAQEKLADLPNVEIQEAYVKDLPEGIHFRAATLLLVLHFLPDDGNKLALLRDIANRLKSGAPFVIAGIFGSKEELIVNLEILKTLFPPDFMPEDLEERLERIRDQIQYIPEARLIELFEEAGFERPTRFFQMAIWGAWVSRKK